MKTQLSGHPTKNYQRQRYPSLMISCFSFILALFQAQGVVAQEKKEEPIQNVEPKEEPAKEGENVDAGVDAGEEIPEEASETEQNASSPNETIYESHIDNAHQQTDPNATTEPNDLFLEEHKAAFVMRPLQTLALQFSAKGFFLPTLAIASDATASFGRRNLQAPTAAYPLRTPTSIHSWAPQDISKNWRHDFSVSQTRVAFVVEALNNLEGKIEIDFIDFTKSQPTVASIPRLRMAYVKWQINNAFYLQLGQDWDLFSPLNPHGFNYVGGLFQAGNVGFMRHQFRLGYTQPLWSFELGIANTGINPSYNDGGSEIGGWPAFTGRLTLTPANGQKVGLSVIAAAKGYFDATGTIFSYHPVYGINLFSELHFTKHFELRLEGYFGENLADDAVLALSQRNTTAGINIREAGGFLSGKYSVCPGWHIHGAVGYASVINNNKDIVPFYFADKPIQNAKPAIGSSTESVLLKLENLSDDILNKTPAGLKDNLALRAGTSFEIFKNFQLFLEYQFFYTQYVFDATLPLNTISNHPLSHVLQVGSLWNF